MRSLDLRDRRSRTLCHGPHDIGASRLVAAGGSIIAQDEGSSAVWGMPRAVVDAGLACAVLPPVKIARRIALRAEEALCR